MLHQLFVVLILGLLSPGYDLQFASVVKNCPKLCAWCVCVHGGQVFTARDGSQYEAYLGIPYAQKPVGNLRFKSPKPNVIGPFALTGEKHKCVQQNLFSRQITGNEDCLYLNVYRPRGHQKLPVFVYLPHSNFMYGSGLLKDIAPDLVMEGQNVVLVVIQYRVGLLGFFTTGDEHAPGNLGLKDQKMALRWVKDTIQNFSGDKNEITVFGDASVQYQLMQPKIHFNRAIITGNYAFSYFQGTGAMSITQAKSILKVFSWALYNMSLSSADLVTKMQQEPVSKILSVTGNLHGPFFFPFHNFGPVLDAKNKTEISPGLIEPVENFMTFLTDTPTNLWAKMKHDVLILLGFSDYYGQLNVELIQNFTPIGPMMTTRSALKYYLDVPNNLNASKVAKYYKINDRKPFNISYEEQEKYVKMFNDRFYKQALFKTIKIYNDNHPDDKRLYLYVLNERSKYGNAEALNLFHSFEKNIESSKVIHQMIDEFMRSGVGPQPACNFTGEFKKTVHCKFTEVVNKIKDENVDENLIKPGDEDIYNNWRDLRNSSY